MFVFLELHIKAILSLMSLSASPNNDAQILIRHQRTENETFSFKAQLYVQNWVVVTQ